jgi:hypothetical protein
MTLRATGPHYRSQSRSDMVDQMSTITLINAERDNRRYERVRLVHFQQHGSNNDFEAQTLWPNHVLDLGRRTSVRITTTCDMSNALFDSWSPGHISEPKNGQLNLTLCVFMHQETVSCRPQGKRPRCRGTCTRRSSSCTPHYWSHMLSVP